MMANILFIVWRECFEALLVVGILHACIRQSTLYKTAVKYLWGGVIGGLLLSVVLSYMIQHAETELSGRALEFFEAAIMFTAAILMTHMCIWMKTKAKEFRKQYQHRLENELSKRHLLGIALLACLAVAREGAELVIFLYGLSVDSSTFGNSMQIFLIAAASILLTGASGYAFYRGLKFFNTKWFFKITTIFLFLTASSLLLTTTRKLIQMEAISPLKDAFWDTSGILDERYGLGRAISTITGYESTPSLMTIIVFFSYWTLTMFFYFYERPKTGVKKIALA